MVGDGCEIKNLQRKTTCQLLSDDGQRQVGVQRRVSLAFPQNQKVERALFPPSMMNIIIGKVSSVWPGFILSTSSD